MRRTPQERFWEKVKKTPTCWLWIASIDGHGYGSFHMDGKTRYAYHVAYEWLVGRRPAGMDLDHLCRNRACVNPAHLEPVSRGENLHRSPITQTSINAKKTHCIHGHEYTPENTRRDPWRRCETCRREGVKRRRLARKGPTE